MKSAAEITETKTVSCPACRSAHVVKVGTRNGYQRYLCRGCSKRFRTNGKAAGRRFTAEQVGGAIEMFYAGVSYKRIAENLVKTYDIAEPSKATIYQWVRAYTKGALRRIERLSAKTSGQWEVDDMRLGVGGKRYWLWNVMDQGTGYLLTSHLTERRDALAVEAVLKRAAAAAAMPPGTVCTTRLPCYIPAVKRVFPHAEHIQLGAVSNREDDNSLSEQVQGMFRQRAQTLRGLSSKESGQFYLAGWTLDYNFFRDHESMEGKSPGQAAKVKSPFKDWAEVVRWRGHYRRPHQEPVPDGVDVPGFSSDPSSRRLPIPNDVDVPR